MSQLHESSPKIFTRRNNRNLAWLLIGAGALILLRNNGLLNSGIWSVLWPIGLIAFGLELVTEGKHRRRIVTGALTSLLVLVPLVGAAQFIKPQPEASHENYGQPHGVSGDIDRMDGTIKLTAGSLSIRSLDESNTPRGANRTLIELDPGNYLPQYYRQEGRVGRLNIDAGPAEAGELDLRLARDLPLDLSIEMGAGNAEPLDFEDLRLEHLNLNTGFGNTQITLPERGAMDVTIAGVAGNVEINVPDDLPARIMVEKTAGNVEVPERFTLQNGAYTSADYTDNASNRATIRITKSLGNVEIR